MSAKEIRMPREFEFANDAFALVPELTEDGARTQAKLDALRAAKAKQDKAQLPLPVDNPAPQA